MLTMPAVKVNGIVTLLRARFLHIAAVVACLIMLFQLASLSFTSPYFSVPSSLETLRSEITVRQGRILADVLGSVRVSAVNYQCPKTIDPRYAYLQAQPAGTSVRDTPFYVIALNLFNAQSVLPDLILQLLTVIRHIGTKHVYLAIYENGSSDRTKADLTVFKMLLKGLGVRHDVIMDTSVRPVGMHRIEYLAGVRNRVIDMIVDFITVEKLADRVKSLVFLNDVFICANDIFELMHQSVFNRADMTCALDYARSNTLGFYDSWVMRDINGYPMTKWAVKDFIRDPETNKRLNKDLPFQAYCCWNGATVLNPSVFLPPNNIRFRREFSKNITLTPMPKQPLYSKCSGSEINQLCLDMAKHGFHRRIIVPRVKLAYVWSHYRDLHVNKMFPHDAAFPAEDSVPITYRPEPKQSFCMPMDSAAGLSGKGRSPEGPSGWEVLDL